MSQVVSLRSTKAPKVAQGQPKVTSRAHKRRMSRLRYAAGAIGTVALTLTGLSLSHLAEGVQALTHGTEWHSWAMAAGIDLGFIGLELGQLVVTTERLRATVARYANPTIIGTLIASAIMNAYAFGSRADNWEQLVSACALGCAVPALIYVLTKVSAAMWIEAQRTA
jgi:hypothetical protein